MELLAVVSGYLLLAEAQEASGVVVEDVALLGGRQKRCIPDHLHAPLDRPGQTIWSEPNITRFANPASTMPRRYR